MSAFLFASAVGRVGLIVGSGPCGVLHSGSWADAEGAGQDCGRGFADELEPGAVAGGENRDARGAERVGGPVDCPKSRTKAAISR